MLNRVRALLAVLLVPLFVACSKPKAPAARKAPPVEPSPPSEPAPSSVAPARPPQDEVAHAGASPEPGRSGSAAPAVVPEHRCVVQREHALGAGEQALVGMLGTTAVAVVLESGGRTLALWSDAAGEGGFVRGAVHPLAASAQRASLHCAERCELALVDERARLLSFAIDAERILEKGALATGLDRRFAPAVTQHGKSVLFAYTSAVDEAMHTWLVVRREKASAPRDLTPPGHGAAAPSFVLGSERPLLLAIDARAGLSPLLEFALDDSFAPKGVHVRTPVSQPYAPPQLAGVQWAGDDVEVFYTAVGRAAMTAIGRVPLRVAAEPTALAPSRGYGELRFSAALSPRRTALLAVEVPSAPEPASPRRLALKLMSKSRTHDALTLARDGQAARPSLVARGEGAYLLAYASHGKLYAAELACGSVD